MRRTQDAFSASRGILKGTFSTREFLEFRRQERLHEEAGATNMTSARQPLTVKTCVQTCTWVPSQWEGVTTDGRPVYARYRYGYLSVRVGRPGQTVDEAITSGRPIVGRAIGDALDGCMTYHDLKRHTRGAVQWPRKRPRERTL